MKQQILWLFKLSELNATRNSHKKYKKLINSKLPNWPKPVKTSQNQPKSQILIHKKGPIWDLYKITLVLTD